MGSELTGEISRMTRDPPPAWPMRAACERVAPDAG